MCVRGRWALGVRKVVQGKFVHDLGERECSCLQWQNRGFDWQLHLLCELFGLRSPVLKDNREDNATEDDSTANDGPGLRYIWRRKEEKAQSE